MTTTRFAILTAVGLGVLAATTVRAQQGSAGSNVTTPSAARSASDGIYSEGQSTRGRALYDTVCGSCHGQQLEGSGMAPPLAADDFQSKWKGRTVGVLFERIRVTMPSDNPETLTPQQTADLVAFLLRFNGYPPGAADLAADTDSLQRIRITAGK